MKTLFAFLILCIQIPFFSVAQIGSLDNSFSNDGVKEMSIAKSSAINTIPLKLSNGAYVCAGAFIFNGSYFKLLTKYNANGTVDVGFGNNGYAFDFSDTLYSSPKIAAVLQSNGNIIVASTTKSPNVILPSVTIHCYLPNGVLNNGFGINGKIEFKNLKNTYFDNIILDSNDKVVIKCSRYSDTSFLFRLASNGQIDSSFGVNGFVKYKTLNMSETGSAIKLKSNQFISACKQSGFTGTEFRRFFNNGLLDNSFGTNGIKMIDSLAVVSEFVELSNNKILISSNNRFIQLLPNGTIDSSFGNNGIVKFPTNVLKNGGYMFELISSNIIVNDFEKMALYKMSSNGSIDSGFGTNGTKTLFNYEGNTRVLLAENLDQMIITGNSIIPTSDFNSNYTPSLFIGKLDTNGNWVTSFGNGGYHCKMMGYNFDDLISMDVLADNSVIAVGRTLNPSNATTYNYLTKVLPNGALDVSFGNNGIQHDTASVTGCEFMLRLNTAKYLVAGDNGNMILTRYNTNGTRDSTFGTYGVNSKTIGPHSIDYTTSLAADSNNNIYRVINGLNYSRNKAYLFKYNSSGATANNFGVNGIASIQIDSNKYVVSMQDVKLQNDGKIIVGGFVDSTAGNFTKRKRKMVFCRFKTNGSADSSFGKNGVSIMPVFFNDSSQCWRLKLQSTGKIIAVGYNRNKEFKDVIVVRLNTNGSLDSTFGSNGIFVADINGNEDEANDLWILSNDQIVVAGNTKLPFGDVDQFVIKLNANGTTDNNFGINGLFIYSAGSNGAENSTKLVVTQNELSAYVGGYYHDKIFDYNIFIAKIILNYALGTLDFTNKTSNQLLLFPNPVQTKTTLEYDLIKEEIMNIQIIDIQGKMIKSICQNQLQTKGKHRVDIELNNDVPAGTYVLVLSSNNHKQFVKFTKQ
jgi:uncharacterized delta-60 repeat protein